MEPQKNSSIRGNQFIHQDNREIVTDSDLESRVSYCFGARRDVLHMRDQWPVVPYRDQQGQMRNHIFDRHFTLDDGRRIAAAVKPSQKVVSTGLKLVIAQIRQQGTFREFADGIVIITEMDCTADDSANARNILRARRLRNESEFRLALAELQAVQGTVLFGDLIRSAPVQAFRRNALWCLIDLGILLPLARERVNDRTKMRVNRAALTKEAA